MSEEETDRKAAAPARRGCLATGCMILALFLLLILVVAGVGAYYVVTQVNRYTSTAPAPVPRHELKPGEREALDRRVKEFAAAPSPARLALSPDDLNAFIAAAGGNAAPVHARIKDKKVYVDVSIPLKDVKPPFTQVLDGRYFNGVFGLDLAMEDGRLTGRIATAIAGNGEALPDEYLDLMNHEKLAGVLSGEGSLLPQGTTAKKVTVTDQAVVLEK
jgi:hypothetical protein